MEFFHFHEIRSRVIESADEKRGKKNFHNKSKMIIVTRICTQILNADTTFINNEISSMNNYNAK